MSVADFLFSTIFSLASLEQLTSIFSLVRGRSKKLFEK